MTEYRKDSPLYTIPPTKHTGTIKFNPVVDNRIDKVTGEAGETIRDVSGIYRTKSMPFSQSASTQFRNPLQLDENELFHENTIIGNCTCLVNCNCKKTHIHLAQEILDEYARGKQTIEATILSGDYMSISNGRRKQVRNYIPQAGDRHIYLDEGLRPMSNYVNGYPKEFIVTSVLLEFSMDSGVSYKVTAQEIVLF